MRAVAYGLSILALPLTLALKLTVQGLVDAVRSALIPLSSTCRMEMVDASAAYPVMMKMPLPKVRWSS